MSLKFFPGIWGLLGSTTNDPSFSPISGAAFVGGSSYTGWRQLETALGTYDWTDIDADLAKAQALGKKYGLWFRADSTSASNARTPSYMDADPSYGGSSPRYGSYQRQNTWWTAVIWNANVKARYKAALDAIANRYDANNDFAFLILGEQTTQGWSGASGLGWSCATEIASVIEIMEYAWSMFPNTPVFYCYDWACSTQAYDDFEASVLVGDIGCWVINTRPCVQNYQDHVYGITKANFDDIALLTFIDGWNNDPGACSYTLQQLLEKNDGTANGYKARYVTVDLSGHANVSAYIAAVAAYWSAVGGVFPWTTRPTSDPWLIVSAPVFNSVVDGDGQCTLNWSTVAGASQYNGYRSQSDPVTKADTKLTDISPGHVDTTVVNGAGPYYYAIEAQAGEAVSPLSNQLEGNPTGPPPAEPPSSRLLIAIN